MKSQISKSQIPDREQHGLQAMQELNDFLRPYISKIDRVVCTDIQIDRKQKGLFITISLHD